MDQPDEAVRKCCILEQKIIELEVLNFAPWCPLITEPSKNFITGQKLHLCLQILKICEQLTNINLEAWRSQIIGKSYEGDQEEGRVAFN